MMANTERRLRILLVVSSYLPNLGGLQRVSSTLASEFKRRGFDVKVLTNLYPRTLPRAEEIDGVCVDRLLLLIPRWRYVQSGRFDLALASLFFFPLSLARLLSAIERFQPDVVNLHFVGAPALFLVVAHRLLRFRFVVSMHGDDVEGLARGTWFDRWVFRRTLAEADAVTACSQYLLNEAQVVEPGIAGKSSIVYNGIELPGKSNDRVGGSLVAVGRFMPKKGFDILLQATRQLLDAGSTVHVMLIGDGPERARLQAQARALQLEGSVELCGPMDRSGVQQAIRKSSLVVIPSRQEPFGMVALEAMSEGKPIVATRAGGLPEVLDGADALLVEPDNASLFADAIAKSLARLEREPAFGMRNRDVAARFGVARMVDQYQRVYRDSDHAN